MPLVTTMPSLTKNLRIYCMLKISCIRNTCAKKALLINLNSLELKFLIFILYKERRNHTMHLYLNSLKMIKIKETWRTINRLIGKTIAPRCFSLVIDNNQLSTDQLAIANHLSNHFANIASKLVDNLSNSNRRYRDFLNPFTSQ